MNYDPLLSLKEILGKIPPIMINDKQYFIWKMPRTLEIRDIHFLNYVVTESKKEWEDQILALAQILIEGLCSETINKLAKRLNCRDKDLRSVKQLVKCLETLGVSKDEIEIFSKPLTELWELRSTIVVHTGKLHPKDDLKRYFRDLVGSCDKGTRKLVNLIEQGILNI